MTDYEAYDKLFSKYAGTTRERSSRPNTLQGISKM